eukprot:300502_1
MGEVYTLFSEPFEPYEPAQPNPINPNYVVPLPDMRRINFTNYIHHMTNGILPKDIINICTKFIGYILHSDILSDDENGSLYRLLKEHHIEYGIHSPLMDRKHITQFALLFRYRAANGEGKKRTNLDCHTVIKQCGGRENVLMILHTGYDHVFSLFFKGKLPWRDVPEYPLLGPRQSTSDQLAMFLLRSQFVYADHVALSHTACPRVIRLKNGW